MNLFKINILCICCVSSFCWKHLNSVWNSMKINYPHGGSSILTFLIHFSSVLFTARVYPNQLYHTAELFHHGWNWTPMMLKSRLRSSARREWLHLKSVSCCFEVMFGIAHNVTDKISILFNFNNSFQVLSFEIHMALLKCVSSVVTKSYESWNRLVWNQIYQKICTIWSRRP